VGTPPDTTLLCFRLAVFGFAGNGSRITLCASLMHWIAPTEKETKRGIDNHRLK